VSVSDGSPSIASGKAVVSMNSTSPPMPVTAKPVATPGTLVRSGISSSTFTRPSHVRTSPESTSTGVVAAPVATFEAIFHKRPRGVDFSEAADAVMLENVLRRFKRKVQQEDIVKEVKRHSFYLKPGEKKRVKEALARKRSRKKARKEQE